jgi:hypothetical protein
MPHASTLTSALRGRSTAPSARSTLSHPPRPYLVASHPVSRLSQSYALLRGASLATPLSTSPITAWPRPRAPPPWFHLEEVFAGTVVSYQVGHGHLQRHVSSVFRPLFQVFQLLHAFVSIVSFGCFKSKFWCCTCCKATHMFHHVSSVSSVSDLCCIWIF